MPLPTKVEIRRAAPADAEALTRLQLDCWDDAYTGLMPLVLEGNERAIRFYERQGFRFDGAGHDEEEGRHVRTVCATG